MQTLTLSTFSICNVPQFHLSLLTFFLITSFPFSLFLFHLSDSFPNCIFAISIVPQVFSFLKNFLLWLLLCCAVGFPQKMGKYRPTFFNGSRRNLEKQRLEWKKSNHHLITFREKSKSGFNQPDPLALTFIVNARGLG